MLAIPRLLAVPFLILLAAAPAPAAAMATPRITVAVLSDTVGPARLAAVPGISPGLLSAGIADVDPYQTFLDIGQGNRVVSSLYDGELPPLRTATGRVLGWPRVVARADSAPAEIVPGLLASTLEQAGLYSRPGPHSRAGPPIEVSGAAREAAPMAADESGLFVGPAARCTRRSCRPPVRVIASGPSELPRLVGELRGRDLLIVISRPPPADEGQLAIGIAGAGFDGNLTSDSTRLDGYVLTTDIAPTILDCFGIEVPAEMDGQPIRSEGSPDAAEVVSLGNRMAQIQPRRGTVIGLSNLIWGILTLLAIAIWRRRGARVALPMWALCTVLVPALLLVGAALRPSENAEWMIVLLGAPLIAAGLLRALGTWGALACACAVTVFAEAADMLAGSPLTALSLLGPNPGLGVRFYGIGNELEAALTVLIIAGTGAALSAFAPGASQRRSAASFLAAGIGFAFVFAAGRFGADVGAAIVLPAGAAVAAAVITRQRSVALLAVALPVLAVAALALVDLISGGNAHLTRSVLDAGGVHDLAEVAQRRLELSAHSFTRFPLVLPVVIGLAVLAFVRRRRIAAWFEGTPGARAGFLGALAATLLGTLANDSGALLMEIGAVYMIGFVVFAWVNSGNREAQSG